MKFSLATNTLIAIVTSFVMTSVDATNFRGPLTQTDDRHLSKAKKSSDSSSSKNNNNNGNNKGKVEFEVVLSGSDEIAPFEGIEYASGTALVTIYNSGACISTDIEGFAPAAMHIHFGAIDENGDVVVDFTPLIKPMKPDTKGCVSIPEDLSTRIMERPDLYYVNAHLGGSAPSVLRAIRGQLVQGFTATLDNDQTVAPFNENVEGAMGTAAVSFQDAGATACFDVSMNVDDFTFGHVHNNATGLNGARIFNFTEVKIENAPGRWFGCQDVTSESVEGSTAIVKAILEDPSMYYFDFHIVLTQPGVRTSIRGQLTDGASH